MAALPGGGLLIAGGRQDNGTLLTHAVHLPPGTELVRKARGAELPASFWEEPLIYMGASDAFIGPRDDIEVESEVGKGATFKIYLLPS